MHNISNLGEDERQQQTTTLSAEVSPATQNRKLRLHRLVNTEDWESLQQPSGGRRKAWMHQPRITGVIDLPALTSRSTFMLTTVRFMCRLIKTSDFFHGTTLRL